MHPEGTVSSHFGSVGFLVLPALLFDLALRKLILALRDRKIILFGPFSALGNASISVDPFKVKGRLRLGTCCFNSVSALFRIFRARSEYFNALRLSAASHAFGSALTCVLDVRGDNPVRNSLFNERTAYTVVYDPVLVDGVPPG